MASTLKRTIAAAGATTLLAGAAIATRRLGLESKVQKYLGLALQAQAGLAVGLTLTVNSRYPQFAPIVTTVVLASAAVFEMVGPTSTRFALVRAGEAGLGTPSRADVLPVEG